MSSGFLPSTSAPGTVDSPEIESQATSTPGVHPVAFIVFDPFLRALGGHQVPYIDAISREARERGMAVSCAAGITLEDDVLAWLAANDLPLWKGSWTATTATFPSRFVNWLVGSATLTVDLVRIARTTQSTTVIFIPSGMADTVMGAVFAAPLLPSRVQIVFQLMAWDRREAEDRWAWGTVALRKSAERILRHARLHKTSILTDQRSIAETLHRRSGILVPVVPMPITWARYPDIRPGSRRNPVVGFLGQARTEKGFFHLCDAISIVGPDIDFFVQATYFDNRQRLERAVATVGQKANVTLLQDVMSNDEFPALLDRVDILVLPYSPADYGNRSSAILIEAAGCGKPVVVPAGTTLASAVDAFAAGVVYGPWTPEALAEAIEKAVREFESLQRAALAWAPLVRQTHTVGRLLDVILDVD